MPNNPHPSPPSAELSAAVLGLIAEMQAKILNPDADPFTITLATLTIQGVMPMVKGWPGTMGTDAP